MYLTQPLHRSLQTRPDKPMTICGDRIKTTREVFDRVARLAGALRERGVEPGDRVGIFALNSDRYHEMVYATWWVGAVCHGVNTRWSAKEVASSLLDAGTEILFVDDPFVAMVPELRDEVPALGNVVHCGDATTPDGFLGYEDLLDGSDPIDDVRVGGDNPAVLFYTGGTSGTPKGVLLSHQAVMTSSYSGQLAHEGARPDGVTLVCAPLFHIAALGSWNAQNVIGGTHLFISSFTPESVLVQIERHQVTTVLLVPTMLQMVVDHPERGRYDLSSVRMIGYGASPISQPLLERVMVACPESAFYQGYGMTETGMITLLGQREHREKGPRLRSAGRAAPHCTVRVVGPDDQELPTSVVGEIVASSDSLMIGYWNRPEETAEAMRNGWMHTGDLGYVDEDGYVYVVDRAKDMIITGGENVYSAEVENAVVAHPLVAACAVFGVPDQHWGERVHAVVVLKSSEAPDEEKLRQFVKARIAGYKAPRSFEFIDQLPLTASGKVLKETLKKAYLADSSRRHELP